MNLKNKVKSLSTEQTQTYIKYALIGGGLFLGYKIYKSVLGDKSSVAQTDVQTLQAKGIKASYPDGVYTNLADSIEQACLGCGTDEQIIYQCFDKLKNNLDVAKLIVAYGKRRIEFTLEWGTLNQLLSSELNAAEIKNVNNILAKKGITYRF